MKRTKGERLNIRFNRKIKLEFHGARLTSDGGHLAYRELDEALGLSNSASTVMSDKRTGRNRLQMYELIKNHIQNGQTEQKSSSSAKSIDRHHAHLAWASKIGLFVKMNHFSYFTIKFHRSKYLRSS
jgi:hypothetical protein